MINAIETLPVAGNLTTTILDQGEFEWWTTTENGMEFNPKTPRDIWLDAVNALTSMHESSGRLHFRAICALSDALNFGEATYGETYAQAISDSRKWMKVSAKTIQNAMWVMKQIGPERRHELLTLSHHAEVASLDPDEQDELLGQAEDENMTVAELKKLVRTRHPKTKTGKDRKTSEPKAATITTMTEAKAALTSVVNYLKANEDDITDELEPLLKDAYRLYRRHWMTGHAR